MTEPQQPAAPLEVDDPEPAPPEPNPRSKRPRRPNPERSTRAPVRGLSGVRRRRCRSNRTHPRRPKKSQLTTRRRRQNPNRWSRPHWTTTRRRRRGVSVRTRARGGRGPAEPRSAGHFVAEALRAAGVRYAFTVPGRAFGVLEALGDVGIRVVATRHEGAAAFMAEAYGQLTGRPAACLDARSVRRTWRSGSTPHHRTRHRCSRSSARSSALPRPRGVPGGRPDRASGGLPSGAPSPGPSMSLSALPEAVRQALGGRPGRPCCQFRKTCSMRPSRVRPGSSSAVRRRRVRPTRTSAPCCTC